MCFSPKSNVTLPLMSQNEIKAVIDTWVGEMTSLGQKYKWVDQQTQVQVGWPTWARSTSRLTNLAGQKAAELSEAVTEKVLETIHRSNCVDVS